MHISLQTLVDIAPNTDEAVLEQYLKPLNELFPQFKINTPLRAAHFLAQVAHESGGFRHTLENLNYSAKALRSVFGKYFSNDDIASKYHRQPEQIANVVYANRMGNGDTASGDGWRYRGRGLIQLTGKANYAECSNCLGVDLTAHPELVEKPYMAFASACWYWDKHKLNELADTDFVKSITKKINGGYHGLDERIDYLAKAKQSLGI